MTKDRDEYAYNCKHCKSKKLTFSKWVYSGKVKTFHYRVTCNSCEKTYNVKRTKYVFDKVKDLPWRNSKDIVKKPKKRNKPKKKNMKKWASRIEQLNKSESKRKSKRRIEQENKKYNLSSYDRIGGEYKKY